MYDFYGNPPKTSQDVRDYLTSWLQPVIDGPPLVIRGETFIQEQGFRRAFHQHCVFRSVVTNEYVWWVTEEFDRTLFPTDRFPTYESMLDHAIDAYCVAWNLARG